ncbi:MAG TPA: agmatine deiminase family protein [Candidatus Wallbacteria bacterium]|nr:agmatine deiminase family protein [Candidatus Wallbacteria bacterium]
MKKTLMAAALALSVSFGFQPAPVAAEALKPLPHSMTKQEREYIQNNFDKYLEEKYKPFTGRPMRKPEGTFWTPGEFEKSEGICFSWAGYSDLLTQLIVDASKQDKIFIGASYNAETLKATLAKAGANAENITVIPTRLDSVWMRDFGPFFIHTEAKKREIIDCVYNRPRPNDDKFPQTIGDLLKVKVHPCKLILPGGNFQTDGHGVAILTDVVFDPNEGGDPNMTRADLEKYMKEFFGMKKVILLKKMKRDGTGHVDMFSKLLDDKNIILGEYATPTDGAENNYAILNENAQTMANETNGLGEKFIVTRIPMPKYDGTSYSYTNSVFANNLVLVPIYGKATDEKALEIYRKILPGHTVKGYNCSNIITANGAIHCITQLVMADPIQIPSTLVKAEATDMKTLSISFKIDTKRRMNEGGACVYWSDSEKGPFVKAEATKLYNTYTAKIENADVKNPVFYFITAEALDGSNARLPLDANEFMKFDPMAAK